MNLKSDNRKLTCGLNDSLRIYMVMTEIGGPMAHIHSHRGLVQPSLVMNHHLDLDCHGHEINISECNDHGNQFGADSN